MSTLKNYHENRDKKRNKAPRSKKKKNPFWKNIGWKLNLSLIS